METKNYPLRVFILFVLTLVIGMCQAQIATFPHTTSFELGLGADWTNATGDDFDWSHRSGTSTPSSGTGPQIAPYGALGSNGYAYIESSTPNYPNLQAWLDGRCDFSTLTAPRLVVNYHMYASNGVNYGPGILQLDIYDGTSWTYGLWSANTSDPDWQKDTIDLSIYAGQPYIILSWTGYTTGWQSDICLDELLIEEGTTSSPFVVDTYPYNEGFDSEPNSSTTCCPSTILASQGWSNGTGDDCDWSARDVNTPSLNTGPTEDQSGSGKYLYMESSGCYSKTAYLESPKFDFSQETSPYIQFYYHMYGATITSMKIEWSLDKNMWFSAWSQTGDQGNSWKLGFADVAILAGAPEVYFRLTGTTGTSYTSDMAFDGFAGFGSGAPLPVTLISFGGELLNSDLNPIVMLDWTVGSQVNNDYFEIQRSTDVEQWTTIETITGAGSTNHEMTYGVIDDNPKQGVSYYRLRQTDYDGKSETFNPISITINVEAKVVNKTYNLMGQEVDETYEGFIIEIYEDGTSEKKYKRNK